MMEYYASIKNSDFRTAQKKKKGNFTNFHCCLAEN